MVISMASKRTGTQKGKKKTTGKTNRNTENYNSKIADEIIVLSMAALALLLFLCNFGIIGTAGDAVSRAMFGTFGLTAYAAPVFAALAVMFGVSNRGSRAAAVKLTAGIVLFFLAGGMLELINGSVTTMEKYEIKTLYMHSREKAGGGVLGGSIAYFLHHFLGFGAFLAILAGLVICIVLITERSFIGGVKKGGRRIYETAKEDADRRRERQMQRREEMLAKSEEEEQNKILRMDKKVSGVMLDTSLERSAAKKDGKTLLAEKTANILPEEKAAKTLRDDIHEIVLENGETDLPTDFDKIRIHTAGYGQGSRMEMSEIRFPVAEAAAVSAGMAKAPKEPPAFFEETPQEPASHEMPQAHTAGTAHAAPPKPAAMSAPAKETEHTQSLHKNPAAKPQKYIFPPLELLQKPNAKSSGDSSRQLKETAARLQQTLLTFGVKVTVTDISQGPSVTRYELQPEQGVKVSKIVGLADDIKLNLAATDIRIEAPIPGKAAVGIEVPNKENTAVHLRELLEQKIFQDFPSRLAFAVGKDLSGQTVVADIAKMPHMLIAGATGSGKSVCINTLIMSILYKAHPDDVKLIMIDPKVVELSIYNDIPHLLIPVVTDPKKASAALHWGVAQMTERYKKFADFNVRDLRGYNEKAMAMEGADASAKLPQIVIIVDELADLMMVAPGEVEESICRLAQLARAAGIHLIIATQRPSVDVITGLIKANMPSRVAFSVSSGIDSRTILDMNGAEKLLGKGDMLFYPQGYSKPARVQGAFVSDKEVSDVVEFLKNQQISGGGDVGVEEQIQSLEAGGQAALGADGSLERDAYFAKAGRFIIEKEKASIGMLQRVFKIGFNRAARIVDQLCEAGVVGEEEGSKPRRVLMTLEEFEQMVNEG